MGRYNLNQDQENAIRNALADRADHLAGLLHQWNAEPQWSNPDDVARTEDELQVIRGLQVPRYFPMLG